MQQGRVDTDGLGTIQTVKAKFMDYFLYAMAGGERINSDSLESCSAVCSEWKQKCCATVTFKEGNSGKSSFMYHCINNAVAGSFDNKISIDNFDFTVKCDNVWASAVMVSAQSLTAAGLLISTIYWRSSFDL